MSIPNRSIVGPAATRVLLTLLRLHNQQPVVMRSDIASALGVGAPTVQHHLAHLRRLGLVDWEDHTEGTLRPAAMLVPVGEVA